MVLVIAILGAASALAFAGGGPGARTAAATVTMSPEPGSIAASPRTQISLRGATAVPPGSLTVTGSRSGPHTGRLLAHSDGEGVSFVPDAPFRQGERVTVHTPFSLAGTRGGGTSFTVASGDLESIGRGRGAAPHDHFALQTFQSRPDLRPPRVTVSTRRAGHTRGAILLAIKQGKRDGPLILDDHGDVVWFKPQPRGRPASDLRMTRFRGRPALTYWEGRFAIGWGYGEGVVLDDAYHEVARVRAGNGLTADLHDFQLLDDGATALLTAYHRVRRDGRAVLDGIVQEVDVATGLVKFEWHSLDHVRLSESYSPRAKTGSWDFFHVNSAQRLSNGDLIVSARNTHAIYRIDGATGAIEWRLGGKRSSFHMGRGTHFAWQHDARLAGDGTLTVFDNEAAPKTSPRSRALRLRLHGHRATLVAGRPHPHGLLSASQGNVQRLPGGRWFVGWGQNPWFTEFDSAGRVLFDAHLAAGYDSYRAYRADWTGRPSSRPDVAVRRRGRNRAVVWASWNGATEVSRWEVLAGAEADALAHVKSAARRGFETAVSIPRRRFVAVRALDARGRVLGSSRVARVR